MKLLPLFLILSSGFALAQNSTEIPAKAAESAPLIEIMRQGGVMMIPLAAMALIAIILILLYLLTIRRATVVTNRFMNAADTMLRKRDFMGLLSYSHRRSEMVARLTQKTLTFVTENPAASASEIKEVAEAEGSRQSGLLAQRITWLGDIGAIAPMLGLLGTVIGMIKSFMLLAQGAVGNLPTQLAAGVSEALVTTASGLVIGITAMVFHSYFKGKVNRLLHEFEAASTHIISLMTSQLNAQQQLAAVPPQQVPMPSPGGEMYSAQDVVMPQS